MKKKFRPWLIAGLLVLAIILWQFTQNSLTLVKLSDTLFLAGMPFLIIGILLWIFSSGFFDTFQYSMHKAIQRNQKKKSNYTPLSEVGHGVFRFWLIIAAVLIGTAFILLAISTII